MNSTARTTLSTVMTRLGQCGATLPTKVANSYAKLTATIDAAEGFTADHEDEPDLSAAIFDAIDAGEAPTTAPAVQQAVTRQVLGKALTNYNAGLRSVIDARCRAFLEAHAGATLDALNAPFDQAASAIADAYAVLGDINLTDVDTIKARGGDAAKAWAEAQHAEQAIQTIRQIWITIANESNAGANLSRHKALVTIDVPPAEFLDRQLARTSVDPWDAARNGWPIELATFATYTARSAAVYAEMERRKTAADNAFNEGYKRYAGFR